MTADINRIFSPKSQSAWQFMVEQGQGCYIPAYQRPYSWNKENISRLFEDVLYGIRQIIDRPDIISFIGTIIAIHDTKYETVKPIYQTEVAPRVMTIIDGQQRICTIVMSNIALHDYIRRTVRPFEGKTETHLSWVYKKCTELCIDLRDTYLIDRKSGDGNYRYYPRVIRAYSDVWSTRRGEAEYESSVANLIWEYINFAELGTTSQFKFNPIDSAGTLIDDHKVVYNAFDLIQKEIKRICHLQPDLYGFPSLESATQTKKSLEGFWNSRLSEEVKKYVAEEKSDQHYKRFCQLLRALIFARYLNHSIVITIVTATNEHNAFDMFEALNTTGEPLTAFETFRPKVIGAETLSDYEGSPSYVPMQEIEEYLNNSSKTDKQQVASEMLVHFALFETGRKLQKKLNDQRLYLRNEFDRLSGIEQKRVFVRSLANVASFLQHGWDVKQGVNPNFGSLTVNDEEALVGFEMLRKINHSIIIAPLARFYQDALDAELGEERKQRTEDFVAAIKATVTFSVLWRGAMGGTENIDSHYRDIMRVGIHSGGESVPPLARNPTDKLGVVSIDNYKKALRLVLRDKGKIQTKEDWVSRASKIPIYHHSRHLARFLVFCSSDNTVSDKSKKGLLKRGRSRINSLLNLSQWQDEAYFTVEHIAPKSQGTGWKEDIYNDPNIVDTLGNLILLPEKENNVLGNRSWEHKKLMYSLLAAETEDEFNDLKAKLRSVELNLSKTANEVLKNAEYLGFCKSVARYDKDWSLEIIEKRSHCFAELAWDRLATWLF